MSTDWIPEWTETQRQGFRRGPVFGRHSVLQRADTRDLFTDEGLALILDQHPIEDLDIATMADELHAPDSWSEVARGGRSGADILEAVKRGRLWVNVRNVHLHHPKLREIVMGFFGDLRTHNPGFHPRRLYGGLLISSPTSRVYYHADQGEMSLWQLRGHKKFFLYPDCEPYLDRDTYEGLVLKENKEEIHWQPDFDDAAIVKVMEPGDFATWSLAAPHKVFNDADLNVSFTTEFTTLMTSVTLGAVYANGFLRRRLNLPLPPQQLDAPLPERLVKCALSLPLKALRVNRRHEERHYEVFEVDPSAPEGLLKLDAPRLRTT